MLKIDEVEVYGWKAAIRGMRNPKESHDKSDSIIENSQLKLGKDDLRLMSQLSNAGTDHGKFERMITVTCDITAPLYWWKEYDTYKVGTVANSYSTMHRIHTREFTMDDFSHEHLDEEALKLLKRTVSELNRYRRLYNKGFKGVPGDDAQDIPPHDKKYWWQMIQLLPSSYNQRRTVQLNYQVLKAMYFARRDHKLDEWHTLCEWMLTLPFFYEICIKSKLKGAAND